MLIGLSTFDVTLGYLVPPVISPCIPVNPHRINCDVSVFPCEKPQLLTSQRLFSTDAFVLHRRRSAATRCSVVDDATT